MKTNASGIAGGTDGLLPCPFCGEMPIVLSGNGNMVAHACHTIGREIRTTRSAWNTRAPMPDDECGRAGIAQAVDGDMPSDARQASMTSVDSCRDASPDAIQSAERHADTAPSHGSDNDEDGREEPVTTNHHEQERAVGNTMTHSNGNIHGEPAAVDIKTSGDSRLRMMHVVESHLSGFYVSQDDVSDIESVCPQCGDSDRVLGSYDPHDAASRIAVHVCDALSDPDGNWLPSDGELSEYAIDMVTALSDFYDELYECNGIPDSDKLDSRLIAWLVRDSCTHIANMFHSTDALRLEEICDHIETAAADEMLARLGRQGVHCDGGMTDDAMISAAVLRVVEARYESVKERGHEEYDRFAYALGVTTPVDESESDIARAFIEAWVPPMVLTPGDNDVWGRESSIAKRIRRDSRRLIDRLCEGSGANPDEAVSILNDYLSVLA